ncbi:bifunctional diguanylate cyclase/phosphodiesterase [Vibrio hangzhouensis]|uniref:Periplasmic sensor diguanylate cyclase/phosphodiesterase n=1 Tax=Vibrio hangzhouensis TaxID=462991 RepID=A0A1H6B2C9_9VIBR|nr:EAL domain-containing protein [Vibrio hangzhouensis]SEG55031.1 periplasmic sensor diguanylate cyclase/phosphodiesterase [Vibrio hangzhouensis]
MNRNLLLTSIIASLIITLSGWYWVYSLTTHLQQDKIIHAQQVAFDKARAIELGLTQALSITRVLGLFVTQNSGRVDNFETYAHQLLTDTTFIGNIQLAPDGIVQHVYPLKGHEAALGHDLLNDPERRLDALHAINTQELTLTGPIQLKQGGRALIGRLPIFIENHQGTPTFWGFASALIYFDTLLNSVGLAEKNESSHWYSLAVVNTKTGQHLPVANNNTFKSLDTQAKATSPVLLPNQHWLLTIGVPTATWEVVATRLGYFMVMLIGVATGFLTWKYLHLPNQLQQAVKKKTRQLETLSFTDSVTGIANRRFFIKTLISAQINEKAYHPNVLLFVDLNEFKVINDRYGHLFGDKVLRKVAQRIETCTQGPDISARLGGDEFGLLLCDWGDIQNLQRRLTELMTSLTQPIEISGNRLTLSASIGAALIPEHGLHATELLKAADIAMYHAKQIKNGPQCCFYEPSMAQNYRRLPEFKREFGDALSHGQLRLYYQPIYCLKSQCIAHYEALIRWQHPTKGLLAPGDFLDLAEQTGLMKSMETWVLSKACSDIATHQALYNQTVRVAINMSPNFLTDSDLLDSVERCLHQYQLASNAIKLELTESSVLSNHDIALKTLVELKHKGIQVALDDFGTGYSSFSLLHELPLHSLKLDKSFIDKLLTDNRDYCVVESVIELAHKLNLEVIAEGIETQEQEDKLTTLGCDFGQGYFFAKPQPEFSSTNHAANCTQKHSCHHPCLQSTETDRADAPIPVNAIISKITAHHNL